MAAINWTFEAEARLRQIYDYIATDNPSAAGRTVTGIYDRAQILTRFPEIGHRLEAGVPGDLRVLLYGHYRIVYLIKSSDRIDIIGVFHGAMDIKRHLERG